MTIPKLIEILQAAALGKVIEWRADGATDWMTAIGDGPRTAGAECRTLCRIVGNRGELRVKPEPREGWVPSSLLFRSEQEAKDYDWVSEFVHVREIIHVREVLP